MDLHPPRPLQPAIAIRPRGCVFHERLKHTHED